MDASSRGGEAATTGPIRRNRSSTRRKAAIWSAVIVMLPVWYVLAAPFIVIPVEKYFPASVPLLKVVYAPLIYVVDNPEAPGHIEFQIYVNWCDRRLDETFDW